MAGCDRVRTKLAGVLPWHQVQCQVPPDTPPHTWAELPMAMCGGVRSSPHTWAELSMAGCDGAWHILATIDAKHLKAAILARGLLSKYLLDKLMSPYGSSILADQAELFINGLMPCFSILIILG